MIGSESAAPSSVHCNIGRPQGITLGRTPSDEWDDIDVVIIDRSSSTKRSEIDHEAEVLGDTLPDRFNTLDQATAALEQRNTSHDDPSPADSPPRRPARPKADAPAHKLTGSSRVAQ